MPRPKAFDPDDVLHKAMQVFWERGYEATSMQDLVDCMGINRFSLYSTFGDKHQLFLAALARYRDKVVARLVDELEWSDAGLAAIRQFFTRLIDSFASAQGWNTGGSSGVTLGSNCLMVASSSGYANCSIRPEAFGYQRPVRSGCPSAVRGAGPPGGNTFTLSKPPPIGPGGFPPDCAAWVFT